MQANVQNLGRRLSLDLSAGVNRTGAVGVFALRRRKAKQPTTVRSDGQKLREVLSRRTDSLVQASGKQGDHIVEEDGTVLVRDDLDALLQVLPADIREPLCNHPQRAHLIEVVLDLGRRPEARFFGVKGGEYLQEREITREDLETAEKAVGQFGLDNRAGIPRTLHRISAIKSRKGNVIGLTCRVGRSVVGHIGMLRDLLQEPRSLLFLGPPGVGKTTVIRELARVLADDLKRRVVIVDTSNEIGGDGDVPHPAIGGARRMQVRDPAEQHHVMIEAVENHMPEVVIVDEIGTEAEATACRTIAERGVMLVGTAHGQFLENLVKNPTLSDLIGGVESVTLGDDAARQRGSQKTVLERRAPPTFPIIIEIRERSFWVAHWVEDSVDAILLGQCPIVQARRRDPNSKKVVVEEVAYDMCDALRPLPDNAVGAEEARDVMDNGYDYLMGSLQNYNDQATLKELGARGAVDRQADLALNAVGGKRRKGRKN